MGSFLFLNTGDGVRDRGREIRGILDDESEVVPLHRDRPVREVAGEGRNGGAGFFHRGSIGFALDWSNRRQHFIPPFPGDLQVVGFQGNADALRGVIGLVEGEMAPPGAAVVPQVMVGVGIIHPDRELIAGGGLSRGGAGSVGLLQDVFVAHV